MSRSYYIVLNDEEQHLYSESVLNLTYFGKETLPQMYIVLRYISLERALQGNFLLFTNIKRIIYND